jgi:hypothetical protein
MNLVLLICVVVLFLALTLFENYFFDPKHTAGRRGFPRSRGRRRG